MTTNIMQNNEVQHSLINCNRDCVAYNSTQNMQTKQVGSTLSDYTSVCLYTCLYLFVYYVCITCTCIFVYLLSIVETGVLNRCAYICSTTVLYLL